MSFFKSIVVVFGLLLLGCGEPRLGGGDALVPDPDPIIDLIPEPDPEVSRVVVAVFGAPWCSACKKGLPAVQKELEKLPARTLRQIEFRAYITTGANSAAPPSDAQTKAYVGALGLWAQPVSDPWRWTTFRQWVGPALSIPAASVVLPSGRVVRSFPAGAQFDPVSIVQTAVSLIP